MTNKLLFLLLLVAPGLLIAQNSDRAYRRTAIMNGNQVRTVFGNWGVIGQPSEQGKRGAWKDDNNGYLGDVSPYVAAEVKYRDTTFRAAIFSPVARPQASPRSEDPTTGKPWAFEPVQGYFAGPPNQSIAISNNPASWPANWPGRNESYRGKWDGYFGPFVSADLETYFVMDDNNFERFSDSTKNARRIRFRPDSRNPGRLGLGLEMRVRALQWAQFIAQDNIFWLYEITNTGTTDYDRSVFGMLVGTYIGVTSTENTGEFDDDWSFYDVRENITYTGDFDRNVLRNPRWNQRYPVGMVGYAFLESPGNPFDGLDNDGDADSTVQGRSAPLFAANSFIDTSIIAPGQRLVLIRDDFSRVLFTVPNTDSVKVKTRGMRDSIWIYPGRTRRVQEGNTFFDQLGNTVVNRNAYDGIDNNFNGIVDENASLHYRQFKRSPQGTVLIDILRPVRYVNYITGQGTSPQSMIDEKRNDLFDNDNDWSRDIATGQPIYDPDGNLIDDVGRDGLAGTNDFGERDGQPTSGYLASGVDTGLPGEPNVDKTDVDESDQIGLSSFYYFTPAGDVAFGDDEAIWRNNSPGTFSVPTSIVNNRPERGEDGDFFYGSGFFPLLAGSTERFSLALVYGGGKGGSREDDILDLLKNKRTVQKIYDANYRFPTPPEKPVLTAVPGDRQVTLYWDRRAENTLDPVLKINDFQGYKIYKSTDPNFSDIFTITDGSGSPRGYRPLAQFDIVDSIKGYFHATGELFEAAAGYNIYLGDDTGLQHSFVDTEVDNGRTYYYAVVAYDRGDDGLKIFPSENTKQITVLPTGEVLHDINVAVVVPNAKTSGYVGPGSNLLLNRRAGPGTGNVRYNVIDPARISGSKYTVSFLDTQVDGIDNNGNGRFDAADSTEWSRLTSFYTVRDNAQYTETVTIRDTIPANLSRKNQVPGTVVVRNQAGAIVDTSSYFFDSDLGSLRSRAGALPNGSYSVTYEYYPILRSPYIAGSPFTRETKDADIFDGVQLSFNNDWRISVVPDSNGGWSRTQAYVYSLSELFSIGVFGDTVRGYRKPADYEIHFANSVVDTSIEDPDLQPFPSSTPVNFRIYNRTDSTFIKFSLDENIRIPGSIGKLSPGDALVFFERNPRGTLSRTWILDINRLPTDTANIVYPLGDGDVLRIRTTKPFRSGDLFEFQTTKPTVDMNKAKGELTRVRVVPNPYVTAASFEPPLPPGITSGRGQRKIDFTNLPPGATIQIFTSRGDHIITLRHDSNIEDGTVSWNLKTKENLDIAYGVYFYVVESEVGKKTGKIAIIK